MAPLKHAVVNQYFVIDDRIKGVELATGIPIQDRDGKRVVQLTSTQAQYYIDQGAIGTQPFDKLSKDAQGVLGQMHGRAMEAPKEAATAPQAKPATVTQPVREPLTKASDA